MDKKSCRLCLTTPTVCFSLLESNFPQMLEALVSIKVKSTDVISTVACVKCLLNLKLAFTIQQNLLKVHEKLKDLAFLSSCEVKLETHNANEAILPPCNSKLMDLCCSNCVICGLDVETKTLAGHVQEHFTNNQTCDSCANSFSNIEEYNKHFSTNGCEKLLCKCIKCGLTFRYKSLYNVHVKQAHTKEKKPPKKQRLEPEKNFKPESYSCDICLKTFLTKRQLMSHTHLKKPCPVCHAQISKSNWRKHVVNHSSGPQVCELCGATLKSFESLRGHMTHTHSTLSVSCDDCGKVFKKRYTLLLHKKKHSGEKGHICETCGKGFLTLHYLTKHINMTHLKLRPYICQNCNKAFSSKFALRTHVRQHTNETPYKCEVCGDGFRQNVSLKAHKKSKHNIVELKTCACRVCGKKFASEHAIMSHMRLH